MTSKPIKQKSAVAAKEDVRDLQAVGALGSFLSLNIQATAGGLQGV